jgi:thiamine-phosphate pyrophosphorylase
MTRRQTKPRQWLIADERMGEELWAALRMLPRGSGILVLRALAPREARRLRRLATLRGLAVVTERPRTAARVHNIRELTRALIQRPALVLLSPMHETRSHPTRRPLPRMRAAALARLTNQKAIALGGMSERRYARIAPLGFTGWAAIDAWLKVTKVTQ